MINSDISGFLNIYKEAGFTSHDVVAKLRGILRTKHIGHTGTLDPMATGVLPIAIGRATKMIDLLKDHSKAYTATLRLGTKTDTYDISGNVVSTNDANASDEEIRKVCASFVGDIEQLPPMYSAKKVNGKKLYELAREGKEVERKPQRIRIESINIREIQLPKVVFSVECSKGTYIRSLCSDIGEVLGCGGCMETLERTRAGSFSLQDAHTLSEVEEARNADRLGQLLIPADEAFEEYQRVVVSAKCAGQASNGSPIARKDTVEGGNIPQKMARLYLSDGRFLGLYSFKDGYYRVKVLFLLPERQAR